MCEKTTELCPQCDNEVELDARLEAQFCPICNWVILPCTYCRDTTHYMCDECPLD